VNIINQIGSNIQDRIGKIRSLHRDFFPKKYGTSRSRCHIWL